MFRSAQERCCCADFRQLSEELLRGGGEDGGGGAGQGGRVHEHEENPPGASHSRADPVEKMDTCKAGGWVRPPVVEHRACLVFSSLLLLVFFVLR